jgi:hypothetical protein
MTTPDSPRGWSVISQRYSERLGPDNQFHNVAEVTIQATDGSSTILVVPMPQYNAATVIALGNEWIDLHDSVRAIGNS